MRFDAAGIAGNLDEVWRLFAHTLVETVRRLGSGRSSTWSPHSCHTLGIGPYPFGLAK